MIVTLREEFEMYMFKFHGNRYNLTIDRDGYYASEVTKRMFEVYQLYWNK